MGDAWFPEVEAVERPQLPFRTSNRQGNNLGYSMGRWGAEREVEQSERPVTVSKGSKARQGTWVSFKNQAMEPVEKTAGKV